MVLEILVKNKLVSFLCECMAEQNCLKDREDGVREREMRCCVRERGGE